MIEFSDKTIEIENILKGSMDNNNKNTVQEVSIDNVLVKDVV